MKAIRANQRGFTLMELIVIMAIMSVLTAIAMIYINDLLKTTRDTAALSDGENLMKIVTNHFLDRVSISYAATTQTGASINIGTAKEDGTASGPAYTLSPGVQIIFLGPSISYRSTAASSSFNVFLFHNFGSDSPFSPSGKRGIQLIVDEATNTQDYIVF